MFCYECGEENPEEAKYCKNCGAPLKKEETVKKAEVIEAPKYQNNNQQQKTATTSNKNDSSLWIGCCCLGLIVVFIISALFSGI